MNAFELEVNGETIARAGRPSLDPANAVSTYRPGVSAVEPRDGSLDILLRVSNYLYRNGGFWRAFILGARDSLAANQQKAVYLSIVFSIAVMTLAVNSFILYAFRRKELSYFFFGLFGLLIGLRPIVTGEYAITRFFPAIPFEILVRLEYTTAMLGFPAAVAFFLSFFPFKNTRKWSLVLLLPFSPFALFILLLPMPWLTWSIFPFYGVAIAAMLAVVIAVIGRAVFLRVQGGIEMVIAGTFISVCCINDILYSSHVIQTGNLLPFSLALFVFFQSLVLAKRFTRAFDDVEHLSRELGASNARLHEQVLKEMASSARLKESLAEKEMLLKEVHHRVKNSLQIVSSIVSLQANRSSHPEVEAMGRSIKDRIRVISLANERLYDVESGDKIDLCGYARDIVRLSATSFEAEGLRIEAIVEGSGIEAESAICIDFGLVLTELVVNAIKHALVPTGGGRLLVSIVAEGSLLRFEVGDEGPGFPESFDPALAQTLGYKIVLALLKRRDGTIYISRGPKALVRCSMSIQA
jgi:two-component sensor histidine kinase